MAESLEERYEREKPRVDAELSRRGAISRADTGITLRRGAFFEDSNGRKRGPVFETVPGVWGDSANNAAWHRNGIILHGYADDPRNLKTEVPE